MKKLHLLLLLIITILALCSCGKDTTQIVAFQNKLYNIVADIETLHNDLNNLDVTTSDATDTALKKLGKLDDAFKKLAKLDVVDEEFAYITDLAKEGSDYMTQSYDLFKEAYSSDNFDVENADLAYKYLERATTRIRVIVTMLHGEIPEGVIVH